MPRLLLAAAVALLAATAATAQAPSKVRFIPTITPIPVAVIAEEKAFRAAERQAYLNRLSQPPVILIDPFARPRYNSGPTDWGYPDVYTGRGGFNTNFFPAAPGTLGHATFPNGRFPDNAFGNRFGR